MWAERKLFWILSSREKVMCNGFEETIAIFNGFEETIANFQWFLRRPSPLNVFGGLTIAINGFSMVFHFFTIAFNGFRWFQTIGQTMRWFRWIVVVYLRTWGRYNPIESGVSEAKKGGYMGVA